jgi:hypothetical protein
MSIPKHSLELPPEAEPARDFIEALVARYESQILATLRSRLAPSILMENRLGSLPNDESANWEVKKGTNGI